MNRNSLKQLDGLAELHRMSPWQKLARIPGKLAMSGARLGITRMTAQPMPVRVRTFWGDELTMLLPERGAVALYRYGFIEAPLTRIFFSIVPTGGTVLDIGAHYGYFTRLAAALVGPGGHVHSFEPTPQTFGVLEQNAAGVPQIALNRAAVFSIDTELELVDYGTLFSEFNGVVAGRLDGEQIGNIPLKPTKFIVPAYSVDSYLARNGGTCDFIKIDAEGAEAEILKGMADTLRLARPALTIEVNASSVKLHDERDIANVQTLLAAGYTFARVVAGKIEPADAFEVQHDGYNLLFVPPEKVDAINRLAMEREGR